MLFAWQLIFSLSLTALTSAAFIGALRLVPELWHSVFGRRSFPWFLLGWSLVAALPFTATRLAFLIGLIFGVLLLSLEFWKRWQKFASAVGWALCGGGGSCFVWTLLNFEKLTDLLLWPMMTGITLVIVAGLLLISITRLKSEEDTRTRLSELEASSD